MLARSWRLIHFPHFHIIAMGPSVKCANWPSQSNCGAISCTLSSKTPTFITIHEMQPFPGKCGEMQMFKGWWSLWQSAGRPLCPAQVGHDSYLLWQRPVSTHTPSHTLRSKSSFFLFLAVRMPGIFFLCESNKGTWYPSASENQLPLNIKEKFHMWFPNTKIMLHEWRYIITETVDAVHLQKHFSKIKQVSF